MSLAVLLPFQEVGARFLAARRRALLADEMRVGKTPQAIRACDYAGVTSVLVLCPSIARANWLAEFKRFGGRDGVMVRGRKDMPRGDLVVCSYDLLIQQRVYAQLAKAWGAVIVDECHFIKGDTKRTAAAFQIIRAARHAWALSGTPWPNHQGEAYALLRAFGKAGCTEWDFLEQFTVRTHEGKVVGNRNEETLRKILEPIMLRRTLAQVSPEMPAIRWSSIVVEPGKVLPEALASLDLDAAKQQVVLLESLLQAQQDFDTLDPEVVGDFRRLVALQKVEPVAELLDQELQNTDHQIVVFAWHTDVLDALAHLLSQYRPILLHGKISERRRQDGIQQFQLGISRIVLGQILAAGTAIDLSVADDVLFVELDWTPGNNAQAAMRVMSQFNRRPKRARTVSIAGTIDEAIGRTLSRKTRNLAATLQPTTEL